MTSDNKAKKCRHKWEIESWSNFNPNSEWNSRVIWRCIKCRDLSNGNATWSEWRDELVKRTCDACKCVHDRPVKGEGVSMICVQTLSEKIARLESRIEYMEQER